MVDKHIRFPPLFCCVCPSHSVTDKRSGLPIGGAEQQKIQLLRLLIQQFSTNSKCSVYSRGNLMRLLHLNANMIRHQQKEQGCRRETSFKPDSATWVLRTNNTKPDMSCVAVYLFGLLCVGSWWCDVTAPPRSGLFGTDSTRGPSGKAPFVYSSRCPVSFYRCFP